VQEWRDGLDVESEVENFDKWLAEGGEGSSKPKGSSMTVGSSKVMGSSKAVGSSMEQSCKVVGSSKAVGSSKTLRIIKQAEIFPVGSYVAAVYDDELYVAQVEGREPEGYTLLKYMERKGNNQFVWGSVNDTLKTIVYC
jgi:hypothetical protein